MDKKKLTQEEVKDEYLEAWKDRTIVKCPKCTTTYYPFRFNSETTYYCHNCGHQVEEVL